MSDNRPSIQAAPWADRNFEIFSLWRGNRLHPTLAELGQQFQLSPERVRQIVAHEERMHVSLSKRIPSIFRARRLAAEAKTYGRARILVRQFDGGESTPEKEEKRIAAELSRATDVSPPVRVGEFLQEELTQYLAEESQR